MRLYICAILASRLCPRAISPVMTCYGTLNRVLWCEVGGGDFWNAGEDGLFVMLALMCLRAISIVISLNVYCVARVKQIPCVVE